MRRRAIIAGGGALTAAAAAARAQAPGRTYRLGMLGLTAEAERGYRESFFPELERQGFVLGRNLLFESRFGPTDTLPTLARELLGGRPDAVVAIGSLAARALRDASTSVPIVLFADDPVALGFAASIARPGGNITGVANMVGELQAKRLELLVEAMPGMRRVGALLKTSTPTRAAGERVLNATADARGVTLSIVHADSPAEYPGAFTALRAAGVEGLVIGNDPLFSADAALLAALAREAGLPTSCEWLEMARAGCLLGYGPERNALRRRMADKVARIFRGAAPGEIPIEQPTLFELAVNLRTARALGVVVPPALLASAAEVIE